VTLLSVDFGRTAGDCARHRAGFSERFFRTLRTHGFCKAGDRVLNLGAGTGTVARRLALRGCGVVSLNLSSRMLNEARRLDLETGASVEYRQAIAEDMGLPATRFDAVVAGRWWHWFDRGAAAAEALRVLVSGSALVIAYFDRLPLPGNVVAATERLIEAHDPSWTMGGGAGIYPRWLTDVATAGFVRIETVFLRRSGSLHARGAVGEGPRQRRGSRQPGRRSGTRLRGGARGPLENPVPAGPVGGSAPRLRRPGPSALEKGRGRSRAPRDPSIRNLQNGQELLQLVGGNLHAVVLELLALELQQARVGVLAEGLVQEL
jgi:SAM-dependent methyltransferase